MTTAQHIQAPDSLEEVNALYYSKGMTDGLPIYPPTPERVDAMVKAGGRDRQEVLGRLAPLWAPATVEKVAISAVMAGCLPEYMPVVVAAIEAVADEDFNLYGIQATTNPVAPGFIINGPITQALGINGGYNCLGQGFRANATIGRAVRLCMINIGGGRPGTTDRATQGWPGKYTLCFAENEAESPWEPLHVERGFDKNASTITGFGARGSTNMVDTTSLTAEGMLLSLSVNMGTSQGPPIVVIGPENAEVIARDGFKKQDVKEFLWEHVRLPFTALSKDIHEERIKRFKEFGGPSPYAQRTIAPRAEDIVVVVAGGIGPHSTILPSAFAQIKTKPIQWKQS